MKWSCSGDISFKLQETEPTHTGLCQKTKKLGEGDLMDILKNNSQCLINKNKLKE